MAVVIIGLVDDQHTTAGRLDPCVDTERLGLRPVRDDDLHVLEALFRDRRVRLYLGDTVSQNDGITIGRPGRLVVRRRDDGAVVGLVLLDRHEDLGETEVSYLFFPEHWGHGYAREAVRAAIDLAARSRTRVVAITHGANRRSRRLLEQVGMVVVDSYQDHGGTMVKYAVPRP